jgi:hypothetical protein
VIVRQLAPVGWQSSSLGDCRRLWQIAESGSRVAAAGEDQRTVSDENGLTNQTFGVAPDAETTLDNEPAKLNVFDVGDFSFGSAGRHVEHVAGRRSRWFLIDHKDGR